MAMSSINEQKVQRIARNFLEYWTTDYGFIKHGDNSRCGLCSKVIINKTSSIKRHFESVHKDIAKKDINERREIISQHLKVNKNQSSMAETNNKKFCTLTKDSKPFFESNNSMSVLCRVCRSMKCSKLYSIYSTFCPEASLKIVEMLLAINAISAIPSNSSGEDGDVPENMCEECLDALKKSYDFQQKCINSYNYFKNMRVTKQSTSHIINEKSNYNIDSVLGDTSLDEIPEIKFNLSKEKGNIQEIAEGINAEIEYVMCDKYSKNFTRSSRIFDEKSITKIENLSENTSLEEILNSSLHDNLHDNVEINVNFNLNPKKDSIQEISEDFITKNEHLLLTNESESQDKKQEDDIYSRKEKLKINSTSLPKTYKCSVCNKKLKTYSSLKDHLNIHTKEKQFLCPECGRIFNNPSNLRHHIKRHSGVKRFECSECPSKFLFLSYLKTHMASHSQLKPHVCDVCGSAYTKSSTLLKHKRIHTGVRSYVCSVCKMRLDTLKIHQRKHTGERPYQCNFCSKSYVQKNDLVKHKRKHLGENIYKCEECPMSFRFHAELKLHNQEHFKQKKMLSADIKQPTSSN